MDNETGFNPDNAITQHSLKIDPQHFLQVQKRLKTFEIRYNDRGFQRGDMVILREYADHRYTGRCLIADIGYVTAFSQKENWVVFSLVGIQEYNGGDRESSYRHNL